MNFKENHLKIQGSNESKMKEGRVMSRKYWTTRWAVIEGPVPVFPVLTVCNIVNDGK